MTGSYPVHVRPLQTVASLLVCGLVYIVILRTAVVAGAGFEIRYDSIFIPCVLAFAFLGLSRVPACFTSSGLMLISIVLCGSVLSGVWNSAVSDHSLMAGLFPHSDSFSYIDSMVRLIHDDKLTAVASRRPLSPAVGAVLLLLCQSNVKAVLALMVFLVALTISLPVREIIRTHGWLAGYVMLLGLFLFYRRFIGTALTEHMGLALACLAFTLMWRSADTARHPLLQASAGIFVLSLALLTRAGAFFVLPVSAAWAGWHWRGNRRFSIRVFLLGCAAIGAGFALNLAVLHSVGYPGASYRGNFPYVLYGLTHGGDWRQVFNDHPEVRALPEIDRNKAIYDLAMNRLADRPLSLIEGSLQACRQMLISFEGAYSFVFFALQRSVRENIGPLPPSREMRLTDKTHIQWMKYVQIISTHVSFSLYSLFSFAAILFMIRRPDPRHALLLSSAAGILLSAPFAPPSASDLMRAYAATMPLMIVLPSVGLAAVFHRVIRPNKKMPFTIERNNENTHSLLFLACVVVPILCLSPLLFGFQKNPIMQGKPATDSSHDSSRFIQLIPGSRVCIVSHGTGVLWGTQVETDTVLRNMGVLALAYPCRATELTAAVSEGNTLALGYDMHAHALLHLVLDNSDSNRLAAKPKWFHAAPVAPGEENIWWKISSVTPEKVAKHSPFKPSSVDRTKTS